ncbi:hypothetical protein B1H18_07565 [Streptomyces tsukubensis]|uniref:DUF1648 domain-containing protein n=1 Tax=Streptomyces tsukubensis TaxID=83656 RepID=A0A1V4AD83_9ACTN|nr:hypothetical protein B1H18_07565 [Streptomyces tsukubensis]
MAWLRVTALTVAPFLLALVLVLSLRAAWRNSLPSPLATHFSGGGSADDSVGHAAFVAVCVGLFVGLAALFAFGAAKGRPRGTGGLGAWTAIGYATGGFLGYLMTAVLVANRGLVDGAQAQFPLWHLGAAAGVAAVAAVAGLLLSRLIPAPGTTGPEPSVARMRLRPGETAVWTARANSSWMFATGLLLVLAGLGMLTVGAARSGGVGALLGGLLVAAVSSPSVTVDRRGLTVAARPLSWPRVRVALDQIERADARRISAMAYGGWGYRVTARGSGIILRSGEAVVVRRKSGREFVVTVRDAGAAAALLNTLRDRRDEGS